MTCSLPFQATTPRPRSPNDAVENAAEGENGHAQECSCNAAEFTAGEHPEQHQQRMQLDAGAHQVRREDVILEQPVRRQKAQHPPYVRIAGDCHRDQLSPPPSMAR